MEDDPLDRPGSSSQRHHQPHSDQSPTFHRGRGRGRGLSQGPGGPSFRGGRGGSGRGGGLFGPSFPLQQRPQRHFNADYTHMQLDYDHVNRQRYARMEGFGVSVMPFGEKGAAVSGAGAAAPGGFRGRGRGMGGGMGQYDGSRGRGGRGRGGGRGQHGSPAQAMSGRTTPDTAGENGGGGGRAGSSGRGGAASRGARGGLGSSSANRPSTSTVGQGLDKTGGVVLWGGGAAPRFVKGGELFKDGEVEPDVEVMVSGPSRPPGTGQVGPVPQAGNVDQAVAETQDVESEVQIIEPPSLPQTFTGKSLLTLGGIDRGLTTHSAPQGRWALRLAASDGVRAARTSVLSSSCPISVLGRPASRRCRPSPPRTV